MFEPLVFVLLFTAIAIGFFLGWVTGRKRKGTGEQQSRWLQQQYYEGLTHLLNEKPDAAIDAFVAALEVNSDTLETHLALGGLLRRRGEVDRAIRIHQNLLARPSLTEQQQNQAQLELAFDYMRSGLLDRAEALFSELGESSDLSIRATALERLVDIYQDEKEWERGIAVLEKLCHRKLGADLSRWRPVQAHFCCELAERALTVGDGKSIKQWLGQALSYDKDNIRAHLNQARWHMSQGQFNAALKTLRRISTSSSLYISEALPVYRECCEQLGRQEVYRRHLEELYQVAPSEVLLQQLAAVVFQLEGEEPARSLMASELPKFPALTPMGDLLTIVEEQAGCQLNYERIAPVLDKVLERDGLYVCGLCGFQGHQLHWCCPSCKHWGTMVAQFSGKDGSVTAQL